MPLSKQRQHSRGQTGGALLLLTGIIAIHFFQALPYESPVGFVAAPLLSAQHDVSLQRAAATPTFQTATNLASNALPTSASPFVSGAWLVAALGAMSAMVQRKRQAYSSSRTCRSSSTVVQAVARDTASEALPFVTLENARGDTAKVYPFGACITSYIKDGNETLALRKDNVLDGSKPIAGGIPICFPQFGPGPLQQHGFARNSTWTIMEIKDGQEPQVVLKLKDTAETRKQWDHPFEATYSITLKAASLEVSLRVKNTGSSSFDFTSALHSYWNVSDVSNAKVVGDFGGKTYLNRIEKPFKQMVNSAGGNEVTISEPTDRVYKGVAGDVMLQDTGKSTCLTLSSTGWSDTVVWNPFGDNKMGYDKFMCVEAAQSWEPVKLGPSEEWVGKMDVRSSSL